LYRRYAWAIKVKILTIGEENAYTALRVELSSESNLFFHYTHDLDDSSFRTLQARVGTFHHVILQHVGAVCRTCGG
jgi:hypothetical protein